MYYTYVIKSLAFEYYYKGHCADLDKRLKEHNSGATKSIRPYIPFELKYFETFELLSDAIQREKYFKTSAGRRYLKKKMGL
jgi:putative endonuclease